MRDRLQGSPKLKADVLFCLCFCKEIWDPRYKALVNGLRDPGYEEEEESEEESEEEDEEEEEEEDASASEP